MGREQPGAPAPLLSGDTVVALGDITADDAVLLAKNSDRPPREAQRLIGKRQVPVHGPPIT